MDTQTILKYVMNSPENTNPNVLKGMLDELSEGGGGSSDFSTANVTVDITAVTDDDYVYNIIMPYISEGNGHKDSRGSANYWSLSGGVGTYQAILTGEGVIAIVAVPTNGNIETSGNIGSAMVPVDEGNQAFLITGDCTIAIS